MNLVSLVFVLFAVVPASLAAEYNYRMNDTVYGPSVWNTKYPKSCGSGKRQSPIDIVVKDTVYKKIDAFKFTNLAQIPSGPTLQTGNNKYSYRVYLKENYFAVEGGGLPGKFNIFSFHFHWGADNSKGSEHTVTGKKYPAELHFVNWNMKYANISEAIKHEDGLAALGVFLEIGEENPALTSFLKYTGNLIYPKEIENITQTHKVSDLFPADKSAFYRYNGSLTTPECQEVVTWTVFNNTKTITSEQLDALRSLKDGNVTLGQPLVDSFRPVQNLNGRTVYRTFDKPAPTAGTGHLMSTSLLLMIFALIAMLH